MTESASPTSVTEKKALKERRWLFAFSGIVIFLFLFRLGTQAFIDYDEATYAQVTKETVESGQFLPLLLRGEPWVDKPPLYFWLAIVSSKIFGFSEFSLRLPAALSGIVSIFLTFLIAWELTKNRRTALLSAGILITIGIFLEAGRQVRLDVPVTMFLLLGFFAYLKGRENPRWYMLIGIATILGFLSKSVISFLIAPLITLHSILYRQFSWLKNGFFWFGWCAGALILTPWVVTEYGRNKLQFIDTYWAKHLTQRISDRLIGGDVSNMTYLSHLLRFTEPWILIFFSAIGLVIYRLYNNFRKNLATSKTLTLSVISALIIFLPFGAAQTKLLYYLTPLYPFMAIACAILVDDLLRKNLARLEMITVRFFLALLFFVGALSSVYTGFHIDNSVGVTDTAEEERLVGYAIQNYPKETRVFAVDHLFWDTIYYYSGGKNISLLPDKKELPEAFLVILPTTRLFYGLPKQLPNLSSENEIYRGRLLTVLSIP